MLLRHEFQPIAGVLLRLCCNSFSPWVLRSQFLLRGKQFDAVLELEESLLLRLVLHALVFVNVLFSVTQTNTYSC